MQTRITARHFEAPPALRAYASARLARLEKYYDGITHARVVLHDQPARAAEITLNVYRQQLAAQDAGTTHEEAIDRCVERLRKQILRYKARLRSKRLDRHR